MLKKVFPFIYEPKWLNNLFLWSIDCLKLLHALLEMWHAACSLCAFGMCLFCPVIMTHWCFWITAFCASSLLNMVRTWTAATADCMWFVMAFTERWCSSTHFVVVDRFVTFITAFLNILKVAQAKTVVHILTFGLLYIF